MNILSAVILLGSYVFIDAATTQPPAPPIANTTSGNAAPTTAAPVTSAPGAVTPAPGGNLPIRTTTVDPDIIECHKCVNAKTLANCGTIERCDRKLQDCFIDQIITDLADIVYNGGCRAKDVCKSASSSGNFGFGLGRKRELTSCSRCCKTDNKCNKRLCGIPEGDVSGVPNCYSCDHRTANSEQNEVRNPEDCVHMSPCGPNEACLASTKVVGGKPEFVYGCYNLAICRVLMNQTFTDLDNCYNKDPNDPDVKALCGEAEPTTMSPVGGRKRSGQVNVCHVCCGDSGCNYGDCRTLREQVYAYYKNGLLEFDTLTYKKKP